MVFSLPDHWVWDFWLGRRWRNDYLFYLHAWRTRWESPNLRHRNASASATLPRPDLAQCGMITAGYLRYCARPAVLTILAALTGSGRVRGPDGLWRLYYTGSRFFAPPAMPTSQMVFGMKWLPEDLFVGGSSPARSQRRRPLLVVMETLGASSWPEEAWRALGCSPIRPGERAQDHRPRQLAAAPTWSARVIGTLFRGHAAGGAPKPSPGAPPDAGAQAHLEKPRNIRGRGAPGCTWISLPRQPQAFGRLASRERARSVVLGVFPAL